MPLPLKQKSRLLAKKCACVLGLRNGRFCLKILKIRTLSDNSLNLELNMF
jgi:hypothetical protein